MTARDAGLLLAQLLSEPGRARRQWVTRTTGGYQDKLVYAAVAQVVALHLWDAGEADESNTDLARRLRDKVRRALTGRGMTWETLERFARAFDLAAEDHEQLVHAMEQPPREGTVGTVGTDATELPLAKRYRTVSATEHHWLGADRCPARHETTQVLAGTGEEMATYLYMFDTNTIDVRIKRGARRVGPIQRVRQDVYGVELELLRPLAAGQTTTLTYESVFSYPSPPEPEFRRAALEGVRSLDIRVEFHPDAVPRRVVFAEWDQLSHHEPSHEEEAPLEEDRSVHRFLPSVDNSIVGFRWTW